MVWPFGCGVVECASVASGLESLRHDRVCAGCLCLLRFGERGGGGEPRDALCLESLDERSGVESHDRRHDARSKIDERVALSAEVRQA
jgi:hypothetical protein